MWRRFIYRTPTEAFNPLMHAFLFINLFYAFTFTLGDERASLLHPARTLIAPAMPLIWGCLLVASMVGVTYALSMRNLEVGRVSAMARFGIWTFVGVAFILSNPTAWAGLATVLAQQLYFWTWFYLRVSRYDRERSSGLINEDI